MTCAVDIFAGLELPPVTTMRRVIGGGVPVEVLRILRVGRAVTIGTDRWRPAGTPEGGVPVLAVPIVHDGRIVDVAAWAETFGTKTLDGFPVLPPLAPLAAPSAPGQDRCPERTPVMGDFRTWLKSGCTGLVILDAHAAVPLLEGEPLVFDDLGQARALQAAFEGWRPASDIAVARSAIPGPAKESEAA